LPTSPHFTHRTQEITIRSKFAQRTLASRPTCVPHLVEGAGLTLGPIIAVGTAALTIHHDTGSLTALITVVPVLANRACTFLLIHIPHLWGITGLTGRPILAGAAQTALEVIIPHTGERAFLALVAIRTSRTFAGVV
jgi:hypothetical protein